MLNKYNIADQSKLLLKYFREKHGFTQDELAMLLGISRSQLSMAESRSGTLPREAGKKFLELQESLSAGSGPATERQWELQEDKKRQAFIWRCEQQLIEMQYKISLSAGPGKEAVTNVLRGLYIRRNILLKKEATYGIDGLFEQQGDYIALGGKIDAFQTFIAALNARKAEL